MKIIKFRVTNYRSISDSGDCYLTNMVTILAGKNESGKTSLLEALEDFDSDKKIRDEAKPIRNQDAIPAISITFEVEHSTINQVFNQIGLAKKLTESITIEITKSFPDSYALAKDSLAKLNLKDDSKIKEIINKKISVLNKLCKKYPALGAEFPNIDTNEIQQLKDETINFESTTAPNLAQVTDETERTLFSANINDIKTSLETLLKLEGIEDEFLKVLIDKYVPYFILFNSFDDIFPNKIPFAELENNEWVKDLSVISDLKVETIKGSNDRGKEMHKDQINIRLNDDYQKFWTQDITKLSVSWDSEHLYFWIKEEGYPYEPSLRSKGRQWHLAFYVKVSARAKESVPNIILIDEPGLFLHATAQKDILGKLEDCAESTQLIFSTHSPYLLEPENLDRIRLIHRTKKNGTKVENKVHSLGDKETLTPILTAIGLELTDGIQNIDRINNVVVEGPSDVFYLQAFLGLSSKKHDIHFIYGGGAGNMPIVGTVLQGWGCKVLYLYDNDQGKKDGENNLEKNWLTGKELIESISEDAGSIEDLFDQDDFKKFVLCDEEAKYTSNNSEYMKKSRKDKVLLSRLFLQLTQKEKIVLNQSTTEKAEKLLERLAEKFK